METTTLGMKVAIDQIGLELKKLWSEGDGSTTRASSINLAVYGEGAGSLSRNTGLLQEVTKDNACRAIVIGAEPGAETGVETWISAHCHLRDGKKQVCSEQISFLLRGEAKKTLPNIVFAELDSDLPLYLWWQAPIESGIDPQLWSWIDRFIFDSQTWDDFATQWPLVSVEKENGQRRTVLCDLNWTRLVYFRLAFAQFFDHPASHHHFSKLEKITLTHGRGFRSTAMLFVGWLAAQLEWKGQKTDDGFTFENAAGRAVKIELREEGDEPLAGLRAQSGQIEFKVCRAACGDLLEVGRGRHGKTYEHQMLPGGSNEPAKLLSEELLRGGTHRTYLTAVEKVLALF